MSFLSVSYFPLWLKWEIFYLATPLFCQTKLKAGPIIRRPNLCNSFSPALAFPVPLSSPLVPSKETDECNDSNKADKKRKLFHFSFKSRCILSLP
ncbi:MAG: hypothetical protein AMJ73_06960 [candidate division Zixibacteria bacterium SM1_73]|nr:MAG: hypothetical protein AMJ73_06960 [candidate division Zixibacteria bacterium SM1_73]